MSTVVTAPPTTSERIFSAHVGMCDVSLMKGDITGQPHSANVVPHYNDLASLNGVAGSIMRAGGRAGIEAFQKTVDEEGPLEFGRAFHAFAGGGFCGNLLNVVTVGSGPANELRVVAQAFTKALILANDRGISDVASPALGTGIQGCLTFRQSAQAILYSVAHFNHTQPNGMRVAFYVSNGDEAARSFKEVLEDKSYLSVDLSRPGMRVFDFARYMEVKRQDSWANVEAGLPNGCEQFDLNRAMSSTVQPTYLAKT